MSTSVTSFGAQALSSISVPTIVKWTPSATGAAAFPILPLGTANQVLTVNAGATDFSWVTPSNVPLSPNIISTATGTLVEGQPNIISFAGLCTVTLPAACAVGQLILITGQSTSTFQIAQNASQQIFAPGEKNTTIGVTGSVEMLSTSGTVTLICVTLDTEFNVVSNTNVLTVV